MLKPSSVKVPVLSKQIKLTFPAKLTLSLLMHLIPLLSSLPIAIEIPIPMQAGNAGGTVMVIKSKVLLKMLIGFILLFTKKGKEIINPIKLNVAIKYMYLTESFLNLNSISFG